MIPGNLRKRGANSSSKTFWVITLNVNKAER